MQKTLVKGSGKCPKLPWMIEFHTTHEGKIYNKQLKAAFADTFLEHQTLLNERSKLGNKRLTQFAVVIPPQPSFDLIEKLLMAGMTIAILKMTLFKLEDAYFTMELIKQVVEEFGKKLGRIYPVAIAMDIQEPEILTGKLSQSSQEVELEKGNITSITSNPIFEHQMSKDFIFVNYEQITEVVKPGDSLILGDGSINLSALEVARDLVRCIVENAGKLVDNQTLTLPNIPIPLPKTDSQEKFLKIGAEFNVEIIFVGPHILPIAKTIIASTTSIILKVESNSIVDNFDNLLEEVDGALIDGDKLIISSKENVFILQKSLIAICNRSGKPVFSTINCHSMTKSQTADIANCVIDGVDGLVLPPDSELLESISLVCKSAETAIYQKQLFDNLTQLHKPPIEPILALAIASVEASFNSNAAAIILITTSGRTAKIISRFRPRCPIIALTRFGRIAKQLMLYKGVIPIYYIKNSEISSDELMDRNIQLGMTFGKVNGYIRMGDAVVLVFGVRKSAGFRNCLEVIFASEYDTVPTEIGK